MDHPQAPNDLCAASSLLSSLLAKVLLLLPVAKADGDNGYSVVAAEEHTVETEWFSNDIENTIVVPNPKQSSTSICAQILAQCPPSWRFLASLP